MRFSSIPGQREAIARLTGMVREGRLPHALMLTGAPGYGGLPLAVALAQYISCGNRSEEDSCGSCPSCLKYGKLIHPDLHFVFPVNKGKILKGKEPVSDDALEKWRAQFLGNPWFSLNHWYNQIGLETAQGFISRAEARQIIKKLSLKTYESPYKLMIIWYPEKMNTSAANTILKILEEPPDSTVFILVAENTESILPTVISRTQIMRLSRLDAASMKEALTSRFSLSEEELTNVVRLSGGDYLRALELVREEEENRKHLKWYTTMMRMSYAKNLPAILAWVDEISGCEKEIQKEFLQYAMRMTRENLLAGMMPEFRNEMVFMSREEEDFSERFSAFVHPGNIEEISRELNLAIRHIEANAYSRVVFCDLCLKLMKLIYRQN